MSAANLKGRCSTKRNAEKSGVFARRGDLRLFDSFPIAEFEQASDQPSQDTRLRVGDGVIRLGALLVLSGAITSEAKVGLIPSRVKWI